jgi:hypothetical protein
VRGYGKPRVRWPAALAWAIVPNSAAVQTRANAMGALWLAAHQEIIDACPVKAGHRSTRSWDSLCPVVTCWIGSAFVPERGARAVTIRLAP